MLSRPIRKKGDGTWTHTTAFETHELGGTSHRREAVLPRGSRSLGVSVCGGHGPNDADETQCPNLA